MVSVGTLVSIVGAAVTAVGAAVAAVGATVAVVGGSVAKAHVCATFAAHAETHTQPTAQSHVHPDPACA